MIAPLKKVGCPVWSYRGAVLSCASPIPKYLFLGVIYWPSDYDHISLHWRFVCTAHHICIRMSMWTVISIYIYYLDSDLQIYRDGTLWSNLALTGGNSRHRKRLRKKRFEVDLPWRMVFPGISQMFYYDDVGSCENAIFCVCFCYIIYIDCPWLCCVYLYRFVSFTLLKPCTCGISLDIPLAFRFNVNVHCTWKNCT